MYNYLSNDLIMHVGVTFIMYKTCSILEMDNPYWYLSKEREKMLTYGVCGL